MELIRPYITIMRPFTLIPPFLGIVSGSFAALGSAVATGHGTLGDLLARRWQYILLGGIAAAVLNGASNTLNQITEVELDRKNKPDRILPQGKMSLTVATVYCVFLYAVALLLAWFIVPEPGIRQTFYCVAAAAFFTVIYSAKPFYTKSRGWWANITIAIPRGCLLKIAGWACVASALNLEAWIIGTVFMLFLLGAASTKDFSDLEGDRDGGIATLPVRIGVKRTAQLISPFFIIPWLGLGAALLPPVWGGAKLIHSDAVATGILVLVLALYGVYIAKIMWTRPEDYSLEGNHVSWVHMYRMMMLAQVGLIVCYLV
jgi:4-hydroxybenzoate polyprenyltransferase